MNIGIPKERRPFEFRVGMTPAGVEALTRLGHPCYVEHEAGLGAGFNDMDYEQAGARIVYAPEEAFGRADLVLKVARPLYEELQWLRPGVSIAGLLHLASARHEKIELLKEKEITAIAYEQIRLPDGSTIWGDECWWEEFTVQDHTLQEAQVSLEEHKEVLRAVFAGAGA